MNLRTIDYSIRLEGPRNFYTMSLGHFSRSQRQRWYSLHRIEWIEQPTSTGTKSLESFCISRNTTGWAENSKRLTRLLGTILSWQERGHKTAQRRCQVTFSCSRENSPEGKPRTYTVKHGAESPAESTEHVTHRVVCPARISAYIAQGMFYLPFWSLFEYNCM